MSFRTYKIIKAITQLVAVGAGVYAMHLGAPPLNAFALIAVILSGPEVAEYLLMQETPTNNDGQEN